MDIHVAERVDAMVNVTVQRWGNSEGIRIPKELREQVGIHAGSTLNVEFVDGAIVLRPVSVRTTQTGKYQVPRLEDLFEDYSGEYHGTEWSTAPSMGDEA